MRCQFPSMGAALALRGALRGIGEETAAMTAALPKWLGATLGLAWVLAATGAQAQLDIRWIPEPAAVQRGSESFVPNCAFCHGKDARGGERGPDLLRSKLVNRDDKGELIADILKHGRPERGMPPFPDLADKAADIAAYLHAGILQVANRFTYQISGPVTGDAKAGRAYFRRHCAACHSPTGDMAGIGKRHKPDMLQAMVAWPGPALNFYIGLDFASLGMPNLAKPVRNPPVGLSVTLPSGETVSGTAIFVGEFDVSLRDAAGTYHSFARDPGVTIEVKDPLAQHRVLMTRYSDADLRNLVAYLVGLK